MMRIGREAYLRISDNLQAHGADVKNTHIRMLQKPALEIHRDARMSKLALALHIHGTEAHDHPAAGDTPSETYFRMKARQQ